MLYTSGTHSTINKRNAHFAYVRRKILHLGRTLYLLSEIPDLLFHLFHFLRICIRRFHPNFKCSIEFKSYLHELQ